MGKKKGVKPIFEVLENWEEDWNGMPEFVQNDCEPYKTVYVHFENRQDMEEFSELIGQKVRFKTKSIWYPKAEIGRIFDKRYIDKNNGKDKT